MSLTKRQASFDRMMEENREREQLDLARREQEFFDDRLGVPRRSSGSGSAAVPSRDATPSGASDPSRK